MKNSALTWIVWLVVIRRPHGAVGLPVSQRALAGDTLGHDDRGAVRGAAADVRLHVRQREPRRGAVPGVGRGVAAHRACVPSRLHDPTRAGVRSRDRDRPVDEAQLRGDRARLGGRPGGARRAGSARQALESADLTGDRGLRRGPARGDLRAGNAFSSSPTLGPVTGLSSAPSMFDEFSYAWQFFLPRIPGMTLGCWSSASMCRSRCGSW